MLLTESKNSFKYDTGHEYIYEYYTDKLDNVLSLKVQHLNNIPNTVNYIIQRNDERDLFVTKELFDTLKSFLDAEVELTID